MMLVEDARARSGQLLSSRGHVVTEELLERLRNFPPDYVHEPTASSPGSTVFLSGSEF